MVKIVDFMLCIFYPPPNTKHVGPHCCWLSVQNVPQIV